MNMNLCKQNYYWLIMKKKKNVMLRLESFCEILITIAIMNHFAFLRKHITCALTQNYLLLWSRFIETHQVLCPTFILGKANSFQSSPFAYFSISETESSYGGGVGGEGESPVLVPWPQQKTPGLSEITPASGESLASHNDNTTAFGEFENVFH